MGQSPHVLSTAMTTDMSSGITTGIPPVAYSLSQTPVFSQTSSYSLISHPQSYTEGQPLPNSLVSVHGGIPSTSIQAPLYNHIENPVDQQFSNLASTESVTSRPQPEVPAIDLPPKWKSATDSRGRTYYYQVKERISQWLPPPPDHIGVQPDSSSTSESSEESSSSNEDDEDIDDDHNEDQRNDDMEASSVLTESPLSTSRPNVSKKLGGHNLTGSSLPFPESKKRRDGLVQERIISVNIIYLYSSYILILKCTLKNLYKTLKLLKGNLRHFLYHNIKFVNTNITLKLLCIACLQSIHCYLYYSHVGKRIVLIIKHIKK